MSKEVQGGEGGAGHRRGCSRCVRGGHKLSTRYEGEAEANPSKYFLLYVGGEVGADKNRGARGSFGGGGSGRNIV